MGQSFKNEQLPESSAEIPDAALLQEAIEAGAYEVLSPDGHTGAEHGLDNQGGLIVLHDGSVAEVAHPTWRDEPTQPSKRANIIRRLRFSNGMLVFLGSDERTLATETEVAVMKRDTSEWHRVLPDGIGLCFPDGTSTNRKDAGFDPECLQYMLEYDSGIGVGFEEHRQNVIITTHEKESLLRGHGLSTLPYSVFPDSYTRNEISGLPFIKIITSPDKMPHILEFGTMSEQLHVAMRSYEAGGFALQKYQAVQFLFGLLTASAPDRDGQHGTTMQKHFFENPVPEYESPIDEDDFVFRGEDYQPFDWREFARLGSPSAGALVEPVPHRLVDFVQLGAKKLESGEIVTIARALGQHTDRIRPDLGTVEICNFGRAGGNLHKMLAVQETVAKFIDALQQYHELPESERGTTKLFASTDTAEDRQHEIEIAHANNTFMAMSGKATKYLTPGNGLMFAKEILQEVLDFTQRYGEEVGEAAQKELFATLTTPEEVEEVMKKYNTAEEIINYFFRPCSKLTATEAIRYAQEREPDLKPRELWLLLANKRYEHVLRVHKELEASATAS